jgi:hypothetical protein
MTNAMMIVIMRLQMVSMRNERAGKRKMITMLILRSKSRENKIMLMRNEAKRRKNGAKRRKNKAKRRKTNLAVMMTRSKN